MNARAAAPGPEPDPKGGFGSFKPSPGDVLAAVTLAAVALPEQMATAGLAGLPPGAGLLSFLAGAVGFRLLGRSSTLSVGADSTIAPVFAGALAVGAAHLAGAYGVLVGLLALATGLCLLGAGLGRLGWLSDLVSRPVTAGFIGAIAVRIALTEAASLEGAPRPSDMAQAILTAPAALAHARLAPVALGLLVFGVMAGCERLDRKVPGALVGVGLAIAAAALLKRAGVDTPRLEAARGLSFGPRLDFFGGALPAGRSLRGVLTLVPLITALVMLQTAATARTFAPAGEEPDLDRDLLGLGLANILGFLFGGFPVNASPPRTAIVAEAGGRTPWAGVMAALLALGVFLLFGPQLALVPSAALAGVLLFIASRIFPFGVLADILKGSPAEFALALTTLLLVLFLPVETGVGLGVALSLAHGAFTASRTRPVPMRHEPGTTLWWPDPAAGREALKGPVAVVSYPAPLSFMNAAPFESGMRAVVREGAPRGLKALVIEASGVVEIDYTAAKAFVSVITAARSDGVVLALARLESRRAADALSRFGVLSVLGEERVFRTVAEAVSRLSAAPAAEERGSGVRTGET